MRVLIENRKGLATKQVDYIFAFHGFFEKGTFGHTLTRPRYEVTCKQLYTEVAIELLKERRNLGIFSIIRTHETCPERQVHDLPTWAPDWSGGDREPLLWRNINTHFGPEFRVAYPASGNTCYCPVVEEGRKLHIRGWIIDGVKATGMVREPTADRLLIGDMDKMTDYNLKDQRTLRSWEAVSGLFEWRSTYPTGEKLWDVYCQTLLCGCLYGHDFDNITALFSRWQKDMRPFRILRLFGLDHLWFLLAIQRLIDISWLLVDVFRLRFQRKYLQLSTSDVLFDRLSKSTIGRRMIRSDNSLIGIAPPLTQPADVIALCEGGRLPLILRPRGSDFEVIGDCYVHGLTDGKLWNMLEGTCEANGPLWETYKGKCENLTFSLV